MTNEEYLEKKVKDLVDEEYQKYLKSLNIPSKEEWLMMEHKGETKEIKHKFDAGDIIMSNKSKRYYLVNTICDDGTYELEGYDDDTILYAAIEEVDNDFVFWI